MNLNAFECFVRKSSVLMCNHPICVIFLKQSSLTARGFVCVAARAKFSYG